jgi:hypothetical protein
VDNGNGHRQRQRHSQRDSWCLHRDVRGPDGHNPAVKKDVKITVTKEETATVYTGPTVILNGGNVTLSATLKTDGANRRPHGGLYARRRSAAARRSPPASPVVRWR